MVQILEDHHHQQEQNNHHGGQHGQHGGMEADDDGQQPIDDQDTDGDALTPQKRPLNNNDVATVFLIDTSEVGPGHDDADQAVEVDEVFVPFFLFSFFCIFLSSREFVCRRRVTSRTACVDVGKNRAEEENITNPKAQCVSVCACV
jgi:hypothetical protein